MAFTKGGVQRFHSGARIAGIVILLGATLWLSACESRVDKTPELVNADQVMIFYGVSSWAMFGAPKDSVQTLVEMYNQLELQETEEQLDFLTTFYITFREGKDGEKIVAGWNVDEAGRCQIRGDDNVYIISSPDFDYQAIREIYENSRTSPDYLDGFYQPEQDAELLEQVMQIELLENWPQGAIELIAHMSDKQKQVLIDAVPADGTAEQIAQQLICQWIATLDLSWGDTNSVSDAELLQLELVTSYEEDGEQPLYLYQPEFRVRPEYPNLVTAAGSVTVDDLGWIVDENSARHRLLLSENADGSYHYLGCPAFDLPLNYAVRQLVVEEPAKAWQFTFSSDFMFTLGRQFGYYPWADYDMDIPVPEQIINTDMPGMDFYRASFGPRATTGETEIIYYTIEESGRSYIYSMHTTDPYVSTGIAGIAEGEGQFRVSMGETDLLAAYGSELTRDENRVYGGDDFCPYDKVYEYSPEGFIPQHTIRFYIKSGLISGIEMDYFLD